jgi:arylsulfatase A-like enzyme
LVTIGVLTNPLGRTLALVACVGDCGSDGRVTVDDLVKGVNLALSARPVSECAAFDTDGNGRVVVNEVVQGVRAALEGCTPTLATASPTSSVTTTSTATASATPTSSATPTATVTTTPEPTEARPNIILINLDDTRADGIDHMPILQEIAARGVVFRNAFVPDSVCAPSRASLLSGRYARHHGTRGLNAQIGGADTFRVSRSDRQTIAVWLQSTGYRTGLFGKYINDYGATEATQGPNGTFYVPPGWTRWRGMMSPEHYGGVRAPSYRLVDERGGVTVYDDHATDAQYSTDVLAQEMRAFIGDTIAEGRPFFAVWTPYASHADQPNLQPEPAVRHYETLVDIVPWRPASWNEMDLSDKPRWVSALPMTPVIAAANDLARQHAYETLLSVDEQIGLLLQLLRERGVLDNTVLMLTSDNGVCWGEHGYYGQGKGCIYEECLRVPLIVSYPRLIASPRRVDAPVLNIDLAPTVAALAGVVVPTPIDGRSFAPWLLASAVPDWRESFPLEYWHELRGDSIFYSGQVTDGDRVHVLYGDPRAQPRVFVTFEFDAGDGNTIDNALAVPIGADADSSFMNLGTAVASILPGTTQGVALSVHRLTVAATSGSHLDGRTFVVETDRNGVMNVQNGLPDYFGVRDVARGYTYAEYETGEVELYDLALDPNQLQNRADDPAFAALRAELAARLAQLLAE